MDRITENFMREFSNSNGFTRLDLTEQFEYFADYCAIANEAGTVELNLLDMHTGASAQGIDGIAIEVNGKYVLTIEEVEELLKINKTLTVSFVFVQAKTSEEFNNALISNFLNFTSIFFGDTSEIFTTEEMRKFLEIKDYIYSKSANMKIRNPNLELYYVSTGAWNENDPTLSALVNQYVKQLAESNLFANVHFNPFGAKEIQAAYRKATNDVEATFIFERRVTMFSDGSNDIGYYGVLPFSEFKKIICSENGNLKGVFEDNIRDFLGRDNDVNSAIEDTLRNGVPQQFSVLNNGITVVADKINITGDRLTISNYQIVNGCQTSHILYENSSIPRIDDLMIPLRLIATTDESLRNSITKATNMQTSIKKEQLEALSTFQRTLEEYYKTYSQPSERLYYERRTGQYRNKGIPSVQVVSIPSQIKAAASMFLDNPHGVSGQYGTIAKNAGTKLFKVGDKPILYYISALAIYRFENFIIERRIDRKYRKARYHVLMLYKYAVSGKELPKFFNSKKMQNYCEKIQRSLNDENKCLDLFNKILQFIIDQKDIVFEDRKVFERKETTDCLLNKLDSLLQYVDA